MAQLALEQLHADEVWWLPAPCPPHKTAAPMPSFDVRVRMVEALIAGHSGHRIATLESVLPQPSHTVTTVAACQKWFPGYRFTFLIGADSLAQLPSWYDAKKLADLVPFAVAIRTGFPYDATYAAAAETLPSLRAVCLAMPLLDVSSTWIRNRLASGQSVCKLVPECVLTLWPRESNFRQRDNEHTPGK